MKAKHAPTPWRVNADGNVAVTDDTGDDVEVALTNRHATIFDRERCDATAEFIARACNSHDELLSALERVALTSKEDGPCFCVIRIAPGAAHHLSCQNARAAIAKAKGGAE